MKVSIFLTLIQRKKPIRQHIFSNFSKNVAQRLPEAKISPRGSMGAENVAFFEKNVGVLKFAVKCQIHALINFAPVFEHQQSEQDGKSGQFRGDIQIGGRK